MTHPRRRVPALDGLRAVAVLAVLESHVGSRVGGGGALGVDVFFVLSGYLITRILVAEHETHGRIRLARLYARRALRLYPALLAAVGIVVLAPMPGAVDKGPSAGLSLTYLMDVTRATGMVTEAQVGPLGVTWSLAVEEHFYLVWPIVVGLLLGSRLLRSHLAAGFATLAAVAWTSLVSLSLAHPAEALYFRPDLRSAALFVGCLLAVASTDQLRRATRHGVLPTAVLLLGLLQLGRGFQAPFMVILYGFYIPVTWACTATIILAVQHDTAGAVGRALSWGPVAYLGRISYGIYLYHLALIVMVSATGLPSGVEQVLYVVLPVALAATSYRYLETPFLRIKDTRFARTPSSATG